MKIPNSFNRMGISPRKDEKPVMPTEGLILYTSFDEDFIDNLLPATPDGNFKWYKAGSYSSLMTIENSNGFKHLCSTDTSNGGSYLFMIPFAGSGIETLGTGDFSVSFWLAKSTMTWGNQQIIFGGQNGDNSPGITIYSDWDYPPIDLRFGGENNFFSQHAAYPDEKWHHWVCQREGYNLRWYFDGNLDSVGSFSGTRNASSELSPLIGYSRNWDWSKSNFKMAQFRIYNRAITSDEVKTLSTEITPVY